MDKIDLNKVFSAVSAIVDASGMRVPVALIAKEIKVAGFADLDDADKDTIVRAVVLASKLYDIRAGRTGGVGQREWFKGGSGAVESDSPITRMAAKLRDLGTDKERARKIANAYFDDLGEGRTKVLQPEEVLATYG